MRTICSRWRHPARVLAGLTACCLGWALPRSTALAQIKPLADLYPVGMTQIEFVDRAERRSLNFMLLCPADSDNRVCSLQDTGFAGL